MKRETVDFERPASSATCLIVAMASSFQLWERSHIYMYDCIRFHLFCQSFLYFVLITKKPTFQ